jgi:predicted nucleic-acid-binding Zn-ribbon protein
MKGYNMNEENKCLKCGSFNVKPGALESTGKIYARPDDAKLETILKTGVLVNVNICFDCGHVETVVIPDKLKSIMQTC